MAASSSFLRSFASARPHPILFFQARTEGLGFRHSHIFFRFFSAQALEVSDPTADSGFSRKKKSPTSSWEEAGEAFFRRNAKDGADSAGSMEQKREIAKFSSRSKSDHYAVKEPVVKSNFERRNASREGKSEYSRKPARESNRDREGFNGRNADREGFNGRNAAYGNRERTDVYGGRGSYRGKGFREEFSALDDDNRANRWNSRKGFDNRDQNSARSNFGRSGFRNDRLDDRPVARAEGAFRREFGDSVDTSKSYFRKGRQGGALRKKQFPDVDGGKRMFKGRFEGNGFVKARNDDGGDGGNREKKTFGTGRRGQLFSKKSSGGQAERVFEDDLEPEVSSEEDEDEDEQQDEGEDIPQAGYVIRHREMGDANKKINRRQHSGSVADGKKGQFEEEDIGQMGSDDSEDDDDSNYNGRDSRNFRNERPVMYSSLRKIKGEVVYGVGPVHAALRVCRRELYCLYVQQNMPLGGGTAGKKKDKKAIEWIIRTAMDTGVEVKEVTKHDLNMLSENRPHQGLILDASPLELIVSTHLEAPCPENGKTPVWVALDEVTDPQNFGAVLRSAYFLGAEGVVVCAKNSAPLSSVVSKASAGALEVMELRSCKNMMKFLDWSAENGWRVVGGSSADKEVTSVRELPRGLPTILVLGGEGKGLRTNVKRSCSELVCIPGLGVESGATRGSVPWKVSGAVDVDSEDIEQQSGLQVAHRDFLAVDSLNVSVAAGILLHELLNKEAVTGNLSKSGHSEFDEDVGEDSGFAQHCLDVEGENKQKEHPDSDKEAPQNGQEDQDGEVVGEDSVKEQLQPCKTDLKGVLTIEQEHCVQIMAMN